jgi:hypothetical protein
MDVSYRHGTGTSICQKYIISGEISLELKIETGFWLKVCFMTIECA